MPHWKRNLIILCAGQLLTLIGFSLYLPFVPYYFQTLGVSTEAATRSWTASFNSGSAAAMMVFAPIWGSLADRYGRKMMLTRATLAGVVIAFLMGLVRSPGQLVVLRIMQGALCGTAAASLTLVATETPEAHLAVGLGTLQTVQFIAQALGPVFGGIAADGLGYRAVFPISSALMFVSLVGTTALVREHAPRSDGPEPASRLLSREALGDLRSGNIMVLVLTLASTSFAISVLSPVIALYIKSLSGGELENLSTLSGLILSVSAISASASALWIGRMVGRFGAKRLLLACVAGIGVTFVPQAMVSTPWQLLFLRVLQGAFLGGVLPTANALLAAGTPPARRGTVFGLSSSAQAGGNALGPLVGAGVSNAWGMPSAFLVTASVFGMITALVGGFVKPAPPRSALIEDDPEERPPSPARRAQPMRDVVK